MRISIRAVSGAFILAALLTSSLAGAQEAIPREYGYKLVSRTAEASYFLSGFKRGSSPETVEAWLWIVTPAVAAGEPYDARAERTTFMCTANSFEKTATEFYRNGQFQKSEQTAVGAATEVKSWSPMAPVWKMVCDSATRFEARNVATLDQVYDIAQGKLASAERKGK